MSNNEMPKIPVDEKLVTKQLQLNEIDKELKYCEEHPLVSVIVPVYNVYEYVSECLTSIIMSTYENLEIIIVNDGSTDGVEEILEFYNDREPRVKLIYQSNQGLGYARNTGLKYATGEYVMFVDSDDVIHSKMIETMVQELLTHEYCDIAMCNYEKFSSTRAMDKWLSKDVEYSTDRIYHFSDLVKQATLQIAPESILAVVSWNKLYRRSLFDDENLRFIKGYHEDESIMHKFITLNEDKTQVLHNPQVVYLDLKLYGYRQRDNSIMANFDRQPTELRARKITDSINAYLNRATYLSAVYPELSYLSMKAAYDGIHKLKKLPIQNKEKCIEKIRKKAKKSTKRLVPMYKIRLLAWIVKTSGVQDIY